MLRFIGFLLLVGFIAAYWWQLLAAVAVITVLYYIPQAWQTHRARTAAIKAEHAAIAAQHAWVLAGDPRGTYGLS